MQPHVSHLSAATYYAATLQIILWHRHTIPHDNETTNHYETLANTTQNTHLPMMKLMSSKHNLKELVVSVFMLRFLRVEGRL